MKLTRVKNKEGAFIVEGVGFDVNPESDYTKIVAAGPLVKQCKMTMAYRPVLRMILADNTFVVHDQMFPDLRLFNPNTDNSYFYGGGYAGDNLGRAVQFFAFRCDQQAKNCEHLEFVSSSVSYELQNDRI